MADKASYRPDEPYALERDAADELAPMREQFLFPTDERGERKLYFVGNSLGLQPRDARAMVQQELEDWEHLAVDAHFEGRSPWYSYHEQFRGPAAGLVGARPHEVVLMNSLTVNLHLLMVSFYRPRERRTKILIEHPTFPSDIYAVRSQIAHHGLDPDEHLLVLEPAAGRELVDHDQLEQLLAEQGERIALVLLSGVNYLTGQLVDIERITAAAHRYGCMVGFDLAHAAGNVELALHDWSVDFAAWCSYKYLNGGPGAVAGAFVHERHARDGSLPRFAGWWGTDPQTRFEMHLRPRFEPVASADAWQLSNPPILALAPLRAAFAQFERATMRRLREKSRALTGYLEFLLDRSEQPVQIVTPRDPDQRGCQLSLVLGGDDPRSVGEALGRAGVVCDFRPPNVLRVAPVPLYNSFHDVWRLARALNAAL